MKTGTQSYGLLFLTNKRNPQVDQVRGNRAFGR